MQFRDYVPITAETLRQAFQLKRYKNVRRERGAEEREREREMWEEERERETARACV
jgi:hypothetical protein